MCVCVCVCVCVCCRVIPLSLNIYIISHYSSLLSSSSSQSYPFCLCWSVVICSHILLLLLLPIDVVVMFDTCLLILFCCHHHCHCHCHFIRSFVWSLILLFVHSFICFICGLLQITCSFNIPPIISSLLQLLPSLLSLLSQYATTIWSVAIWISKWVACKRSWFKLFENPLLRAQQPQQVEVISQIFDPLDLNIACEDVNFEWNLKVTHFVSPRKNLCHIII